MSHFDTAISKAKLLGLALFISSCGGENNSDLSISASSKAFLIAYGSTYYPTYDTCYPAVTKTAPKFRLSKITTNWKGGGTLRPNYLKITANPSSNNGAYTCNFISALATDSISFALGFSTTEITKGSDTFIQADSACSFDCDGFPLINKDKPMSTTATVKVYGIQTQEVNGESVETQVSAQDSITIQYNP